MKFNRLATMCRKIGFVTLYEREAQAGGVVQYIGVNDAAIYKADGLPLFDKYNMAAALDVPARKRSDFYVETRAVPSSMDLRDTVPGETPLTEEPLQVMTADDLTLQPLSGSEGVLWVDARYLAPIEDSTQLVLTRRESLDGTPYIAVKDGMFLQALILPVAIGEQTVDNLRRLCAQAERHADDNGTD